MSDTTTGGRRLRGAHAANPGKGPLVSVVTVVYNGAGTLERTIKSVLAQTHDAIEYIVVDGGSTDGTLDILRGHEDRIDLWVSERDRGIYDAMNKGISLCRGDWIGLINADDWYEIDTVQRILEAAVADPHARIIHGDIWIHYPNGQRKLKRARRNGFLLRYWEMVLNHPSFFVRRDYYNGHAFDPEMRVSGDHLWTLRAWSEDPGMFHYLPRPLANFTAGGASMRMSLGKALREGRRMSKALGFGPFDTFMSMAVKVALYVPQSLKLWINQFLPTLSRPS